MLGVSNNHVAMKGKKQGKIRAKLKDVKVTYISSPMKVKTSASNFRALVQELTGQDSNVAEMFTDAQGNNNINNNGSAETIHHHQKGGNSTQQYWGEAYLSDATDWLKPDFSEFDDSRFSVESLNGHVLQDLFSFDML